MGAERIHILIVDDLADAADSTAEVLALWGYDATACDSGATALDCARLRRPDVVLLDLAMPRMDGFQFARAFRMLPGCGAVPLVAVSGYPSPAYSARALEAGIEHYLVKPADPTGLKALLLVLVTRSNPLPPVSGLGNEVRSFARPGGCRARGATRAAAGTAD